MKRITPLLYERKWAFTLIFFILMFNPCFYAWSTDLTEGEKIIFGFICLVVAMALSALDLFFSQKAEKIYRLVLLACSVAPNLITWSYLYISGLYMRRDMYWVIFNSNLSESHEYMHQFVAWQIPTICATYIGIGLYLAFKSHVRHALSIRRRPCLFACAIAVLLADVSLQYTSQAVPTFEFYKSYALFKKEYYAFEQEKSARAKLKIEVQCHLDSTTRHVSVILLGESTTPCHMSLYGYPRQTTPLMSARKEQLHVYEDVVTADTQTYGVMQMVLTFASHHHPSYYKSKPSIVELFNAAGFETYWIANNPILDKWGASYGVIAQEAKHVYDVSIAKQPDEIVIPHIHRALTDSVAKNKIIFVHLMCNHHAYDSRYPKSFDEHFDHKRDNDLPDLDFRNDRMKTVIDQYDNSIRYGDYVFDQILRLLETADDPACLLYFSDHGEEVYDHRAVSGHQMSNVYPCQSRIPFILWMSDSYRVEISDRLCVDVTRPYSIENVIYSISTLNALDYADHDPSLSIFSAQYVAPAKRLVGKENYEDILKKMHKKP